MSDNDHAGVGFEVLGGKLEGVMGIIGADPGDPAPVPRRVLHVGGPYVPPPPAEPTQEPPDRIEVLYVYGRGGGMVGLFADPSGEVDLDAKEGELLDALPTCVIRRLWYARHDGDVTVLDSPTDYGAMHVAFVHAATDGRPLGAFWHPRRQAIEAEAESYHGGVRIVRYVREATQ